MPLQDVLLALPPGSIHPAVAALVEGLDVDHLSTITVQDIEDEIEVLYHFWAGQGLTLRTVLAREEARLPTIDAQQADGLSESTSETVRVEECDDAIALVLEGQTLPDISHLIVLAYVAIQAKHDIQCRTDVSAGT